MAETPVRPIRVRTEAPYSAGTPTTGMQRPPPELRHDPVVKAAAAAAGQGASEGVRAALGGLVAGASAHRNISAEFGKAGFKEPPAPTFRNIRQFFTPVAGPKAPSGELKGGRSKRCTRRKTLRAFKKATSLLNKIGILTKKGSRKVIKKGKKIFISTIRPSFSYPAIQISYAIKNL